MKKISFERLGVVLEPRGKEFRTVAKFNAGMALDNGTVHMAYRFAVWAPHGYDERAESCYVVDDKGWLLIYHGVEDHPNQKPIFTYRAGAALLDLKNPSKVIGRLPYPILEPETDYEKFGYVDNVVFPVGGDLHNGYLYMSYGGADRCVAMARTPLDGLLDALLEHKVDGV